MLQGLDGTPEVPNWLYNIDIYLDGKLIHSTQHMTTGSGSIRGVGYWVRYQACMQSYWVSSLVSVSLDEDVECWTPSSRWPLLS